MIYHVEADGPIRLRRGSLDAAQADELYESMLPDVAKKGGSLRLYAIYHGGERVEVSRFDCPEAGETADGPIEAAVGTFVQYP